MPTFIKNNFALYRKSCQLLQDEADVVMESSVVSDFQNYILSGTWDRAIELVPAIANDNMNEEVDSSREVLGMTNIDKY